MSIGEKDANANCEGVPPLKRKSSIQTCISLASERGREAQVADQLGLGE